MVVQSQVKFVFEYRVFQSRYNMVNESINLVQTMLDVEKLPYRDAQ